MRIGIIRLDHQWTIEQRDNTTDYWVTLCHKPCVWEFLIGYKARDKEDLIMWSHLLPTHCNGCGATLPALPNEKYIRNHFVLQKLASMDISI